MKKGFTLVELIVVIVLLSLITVFTFPSINKLLIERKEKLYNVQVENIKLSAQNYINKNHLLSSNDKVFVTLCQLKQAGFTDENIKDPRTGVLFPNDSKVIALKDNSEYEFVLGEGGNTTCSKNNNTLFEFIEVGSTYIESMNKNKYNITIYLDNKEVDNIDTSCEDTYVIKYEDSNKDIIYKYVYVIDTSGPDISYVNEIEMVDENNNKFKSREIGKGTIVLLANQYNIFTAYKAKSIDNNDGEVEVTSKSNVNLKIPGVYYITYTSTDEKGNTTTKNQKLEVIDNIKPVIDSIDGIPNNKTTGTITVTVKAHDNESGLHPRGAYSFDGGNTWQVSNTINIVDNKTIDIVVRDSALNKINKTITINNIYKDDKSLTFNIVNGTLKNNGWFINDVKLEIKPVAKENFKSYSYCISSDSRCTPNKTIYSLTSTYETINYSTKGLYVCGYVTKSDYTKTDIVCSMNIKVDKEKPTCYPSYNSNYDITSGVSGNIIVNDAISGPTTSSIPFFLRSNQTYKVYDNAGNENTCEAKVRSETQYQTRSCARYKSCKSEKYCGNEYYACNCSDCKIQLRSCVGGWKGTNCTRWKCCNKSKKGMCWYTSDPGRRTNCNCVKTEKSVWDDCLHQSIQCAWGCDECKGGARSCVNPTCGCKTWNYSGWNNGSCNGRSNCSERTVYYPG